MADVGGSSSSSGFADPGVDTIELFLSHVYVFPCFIVYAVQRYRNRSCTHVYVFHTRLPTWDLNDLSFAHTVMFSGVGFVWSARST